jgi:hypothetical protein
MASYYAVSFVLMNFSDFHKVYLSMNYAGHIILMLAIMLLLPFVPKKKSDVKSK